MKILLPLLVFASPIAFAENFTFQNTITCDYASNLSRNCRLVMTDTLVVEQPYDTNFKIVADMSSCDTRGITYPSDIYLIQEGSLETRLNFGDRKEFDLNGISALKLEDRKPQRTKNQFFNKSCDLVLTITTTPSSETFASWNKELIDIKHEIKSISSAIEGWQAALEYYQVVLALRSVIDTIVLDANATEKDDENLLEHLPVVKKALALLIKNNVKDLSPQEILSISKLMIAVDKAVQTESATPNEVKKILSDFLSDEDLAVLNQIINSKEGQMATMKSKLNEAIERKNTLEAQKAEKLIKLQSHGIGY